MNLSKVKKCKLVAHSPAIFPGGWMNPHPGDAVHTVVFHKKRRIVYYPNRAVNNLVVMTTTEDGKAYTTCDYHAPTNALISHFAEMESGAVEDILCVFENCQERVRKRPYVRLQAVPDKKNAWTMYDRRHAPTVSTQTRVVTYWGYISNLVNCTYHEFSQGHIAFRVQMDLPSHRILLFSNYNNYAIDLGGNQVALCPKDPNVLCKD